MAITFTKINEKGKVLVDSNGTIYSFDVKHDIVPHPNQENIIIILYDAFYNNERNDGFTFDWRDVTQPSGITSRNDMIVELSTNFFFRVNYYTKTEADAKFVDTTGDTMTGELFTPSINTTNIKIDHIIEYPRESGNRTIYVRSTGDDNNDGTTELTAFATIGRAVQDIRRIIDEYTINIDIGEGEFEFLDAYLPLISSWKGKIDLKGKMELVTSGWTLTNETVHGGEYNVPELSGVTENLYAQHFIKKGTGYWPISEHFDDGTLYAPMGLDGLTDVEVYKPVTKIIIDDINQLTAFSGNVRYTWFEFVTYNESGDPGQLQPQNSEGLITLKESVIFADSTINTKYTNTLINKVAIVSSNYRVFVSSNGSITDFRNSTLRKTGEQAQYIISAQGEQALAIDNLVISNAYAGVYLYQGELEANIGLVYNCHAAFSIGLADSTRIYISNIFSKKEFDSGIHLKNVDYILTSYFEGTVPYSNMFGVNVYLEGSNIYGYPNIDYIDPKIKPTEYNNLDRGVFIDISGQTANNAYITAQLNADVISANTYLGLSVNVITDTILLDQDDYNPIGLSGASILDLNVSGATGLTITGIDSQSNGFELKIINTGDQILTLSKEDTNSLAENRFANNFIIPVGGTIDLVYLTSKNRWYG